MFTVTFGPRSTLRVARPFDAIDDAILYIRSVFTATNAVALATITNVNDDVVLTLMRDDLGIVKVHGA